MNETRRSFFKKSAFAFGVTSFLPSSRNVMAMFNINLKNGKVMKLTFRPYTLELKHVFTVASMSRTTTPVVMTEIEYDGIVGYGEASMPPYLGESQESVTAFLKKIDMSRYNNPFAIEDILADIDLIATNNTAAKASNDIALHDLVGKLIGQPWYNVWGYDKEKAPNTTFTIGIDTATVVKEKTKEASGFKILNVKVGKENDKEMIEAIRSVTDVPLTADANQGWKDKFYALDMLHWLHGKNVVMIEQPLPKEWLEEQAWLNERSPIPIMGDESCQRLVDVKKLHGVFSGINIKLMKCTGMREANKMLTLARSLGMKVMVGCMTETSCAVSAASQLSPMVDYADLDGMLLIKNDLFVGTTVVNGKLVLSDLPGIGVKKI